MSSVRRILVAGLPAAGATVLAALALGGAPALAQGDSGRPAVMATPSPATHHGYGTVAPAATTVAPVTTSPAATHTRGQAGYGGQVSPTTATPAPVHTRGGSTGYGGVSPSTAPTSPVPTGNTDTVPPGGVSPSTATPSESYPGGVSPAHALPTTGAPAGAVVALGSLLVAAGAASVWYTRRRRSA